MLSTEIIAKIPSSFDNAVNSGDLLFFPSTIHKHLEGGVEYEIRLCPALQKKPQLPSLDFHTADSIPNDSDQRPDPFNPPYNPNLFVGYLRNEDQEEEYVVLMNKYSILRSHFLLVTKEFKSQTLPLVPDDLVQTYALLTAAYKARQNMFAFYNCGDLSGASQPHKHIQLIAVENDDGPPIEALARAVTLEAPDKPFSLTSLPYANHVFRFPQRLSSMPRDKIEHVLSTAFLSLLDLAISTIRHALDYPAGKPSYNVIITLEHMHVIPRREENFVLQETGDNLSVNALGYAGMLLVKSERELEAVKSEGAGKILRGVGLESVHDLQVAGTSLEPGDVGTHL
ncbi:ATP adenylyltransferase-domain-containing protein [Desarmillaria ectypa]|nr:ATP adenylyltransferase-domain-containing protein [Desarmillaria ectypa]